MTTGSLPPPSSSSEPAPGLPVPETAPVRAPDDLTPEQKRTLIILIVAFVLIFIGLMVFLVFLLKAPMEVTAQIRDVFIIFMAIESLVIGVVLTILVVQLARLLNLLQNEIQPILESTNETVSHLRGTTRFLSDNLTEPVIKLNEYMAGMNALFSSLGLMRSNSRKSKPKQGE